jgi:hypothetical protein
MADNSHDLAAVLARNIQQLIRQQLSSHALHAQLAALLRAELADAVRQARNDIRDPD